MSHANWVFNWNGKQLFLSCMQIWTFRFFFLVVVVPFHKSKFWPLLNNYEIGWRSVNRDIISNVIDFRRNMHNATVWRFYSRPIEFPFYPWISFNWNALPLCFFSILYRPTSLHNAKIVSSYKSIYVCVLYVTVYVLENV